MYVEWHGKILFPEEGNGTNHSFVLGKNFDRLELVRIFCFEETKNTLLIFLSLFFRKLIFIVVHVRWYVIILYSPRE